MEAQDAETGQGGYDVISFGEALIGYVPLESDRPKRKRTVSTSSCDSLTDDSSLTFGRIVQGGELAVCAALSKLDHKTRWVSVLPAGPVGEIVIKDAKEREVDVSFVQRQANSRMGIMHVVGDVEEHSSSLDQLVQFERSNSAFALLDPNTIDWQSLISGCRFLALSADPLFLGEGPFTAWKEAIACAERLSVPVCLTLNHSPSLGTLSALIDRVTPFLPRIEILVVDGRTASDLMTVLLPNETVESWETVSCEIMLKLKMAFKCSTLAVTVIKELEEGRVERFSEVSNLQGTISTYVSRINHRQTPNFGGDDVWLAGFLDVVLQNGGKESLLDEKTLMSAAKNGDLLAALHAKSRGDLPNVTQRQLDAAKKALNFPK